VTPLHARAVAEDENLNTASCVVTATVLSCDWLRDKLTLQPAAAAHLSVDNPAQ